MKESNTYAHHKGYSHTVLERRTIAKQSSIVGIVILSKTSVTQKREDTLKHTNKGDGTYSNKLSKPLARSEVQSKV